MGTLYVYAICFIAQLSFLIQSTCMTWSSPMLPKLNGTEDNPLGRRITSSEDSWLASLPNLGVCLGSAIYGLVASKFGRKTLLLASNLPFFVFNLVLAWADNIWYFYVSRLLTGIGFGISLSVLPIYTGEVAQVKNRGILGASMTVFINIGLLLPYCIGPYVPYFWFHIIFASLAALFFPLFYFYAPESPYFLIRHRPEKARRVLEKIRETFEVDPNLNEIKRDLEKDSKGSLMDVIFNKGLRKALFIGIGLNTFMQLTGLTIVTVYTQVIFEDAAGDFPPDLSPIILGIAQILTSVIVSVVSEKFSRKFLLITSHLGVAAVEIPLGIYFILKSSGNNVSNISFLPLICLVLFEILVNWGVAPIVVSSMGELFPLAVKGKAVACLVVYSWSSGFLLILLFNTLKDAFGTGQIFLFFSSMGLIAALFIKFVMVETKGKTFEDIQRHLTTGEKEMLTKTAIETDNFNI